MLVHDRTAGAGPTLGPLGARPGESLLVARALEFLAAGPAHAHQLIAAVCRLPGVPPGVADHIAAALLADVAAVHRDAAGIWSLRPPEAPGENPCVRLDALSYVVVDVETTGGRPQSGDKITEIAAVAVRRGEIVDAFETLVNPGRPIPPWITALTNISWRMVKDAPPFAAVCDRVLDALAGHVFVAHNARFDWNFLAGEVHCASGRRLEAPRLCTVRLARRLLPHLRSRSLDSVAAYFGVEIASRHRAGGDAVATARVLIRLLEAARDRGCETWPDLELLLAPPPRRRRKRRRLATPHPVTRDTSA